MVFVWSLVKDVNITCHVVNDEAIWEAERDNTSSTIFIFYFFLTKQDSDKTRILYSFYHLSISVCTLNDRYQYIPNIAAKQEKRFKIITHIIKADRKEK